ncbi:MAG: TPM domain-containing protein, partial [Nitrospirota bacterium]
MTLCARLLRFTRNDNLYRCIWFLSVSLIFLFFVAPAHALDVPPLQGYVNDYAGMMSSRTKTTLENELRSFEQTDSTQIVILTIPSLEGEVLEEFSIKVADAWKIGQATKDNGVILLVAKQERKIRIEVGRGL